MFNRILVPVDLEHVAKIEKALKTAAEFAKRHNAPVCYVAVSGRVPNRVAPSPEEFEVQLNMFAREQADKHGIETECKAVYSVDVAVELDDKLLEAIDAVGADLVVMASHIPGVADRLHLISSNAAYVVKHSSVSIFVVR